MKTTTTPAVSTRIQDLLTGAEWTPAQVREILRRAGEVKARPKEYRAALAGKSLALIFEKPSLRTRVTFEVGITSLGGSAIFMDYTSSPLGEREVVPDVAKSLSRWVNGIAARTFQQEVVEELAANASVPVINALSDRYHPCQALADFFTLEEHCGKLKGLRVAYIGDGNNVCHSLAIVAAQVGANLRIATPKGFEPDGKILAAARAVAKQTGAKIETFHSPAEAAADVQAVYTDVWASMGQEHETAAREKAFAGFQVDVELMDHAAADAFFMHCLPAHRGSEVSADVMDSGRSIVFDQAENRLHIQKAILLALMA